jgi:hypothetical protein
MSYVLSHKDMSFYFLTSERLLSDWLNGVVRLIQGMEKNVRVKEDHAEYDSEVWIASFLLDYEITSILPLLLDILWNQEIARPINLVSISTAIGALDNWLQSPDVRKELTEDFKVSEGETSYHIPLHRYLAGFLHEIVKTWDGTLLDLFKSKSLDFFSALMEHPLRIQGSIPLLLLLLLFFFFSI